MTAGNSENHDRTVVDVKLFKAIGLFQTLSGDDGKRYRTAMRVFFWTMFGTIVLNVWGMYLSSNDFQRFTFLFLCVTISLMCSLKAHLLSRTVDAERLGVVLDLARYAFTSCGRRDPSRLSGCRAKLSALLRTSVTIQLCVMLVWLLAPFFVHTRLSVTHLDGTVSEYRIGMVNLWVPLPDVVYDSAAGWSVVYAYEAFFFFCNFIAWMQFDCYLVTTCFALNAQFCTLAAGYEALGRRKASSDGHYCDLICLIKDNRKIVKKYGDFYDVIRTVVLLQIACCTVSGIITIFLALLMFMSGCSLVSPPVLKFSSAYVIITIQLGLYCYAFSYVETAKSAVNFGLYGSNWTEMDLKFKKTVLLAMNMNSCYKRVAKLTPTFIVNLEMLTKVIKTSYSIVSLLLNTTVEQTVIK